MLAATEAVVACGSPGRFPSELLREKPITTGRPSAVSSSSRRTSSKLCSTVLPKPIPGSRQIRSSGMPAETATPSRRSRRGGPPPALALRPLLEEGGDLRGDVVVARIGLHRPRLALHVHQAEVGARLRDD